MTSDTDVTRASLPYGRASAWRLTGPELVVAGALFLISFLLYIPSFSNSFVDYDDHHYIQDNPIVQRGITREGFVWAFTTTKFANWLPVTWLSHELDCELWGLNPGGHHATSAVLHAFNAAALFLALRAMTGRFWAPAAVAALWAMHPLRVESVSWVAERKDVLCGTFFVLALLSYTSYSHRPSAGHYLLVVLCHALGLMSKTMLVTLPCVLLLLDYWPLRRFPRRTAMPVGRFADRNDDDAASSPFPPRRPLWLLLEKLPLVLMSIVSSAWTVVFQSSGGAMWGYRHLTLGQRIANAIVSIPRYLAKIAWPLDLSVFYPHPASWAAGKVAAAGLLIVALSIAAVVSMKRRPYFAVGWFWFLGMLVPVSGVIQVGLQSMADRYTYLPSIGLLLALVWWIADVMRDRPRLTPVAAVVTAGVLVALSVGTWTMQKYWENTLTLFNHALDVDQDNWLAQNMVGTVYASNGERAHDQGNDKLTRQFYQIAADHLRRSVELNPNHYLTFHNYAWSLYRLGRLEEAAENFRRSMEIDPDFGWSQLYLALSLANLNRLDEAMPHFKHAAKLIPRNPPAHFHWGEALLKQGKKDEAAEQFNETLRLDPGHAGAKHWLEKMKEPANAPSTAPPIQPEK